MKKLNMLCWVVTFMSFCIVVPSTRGQDSSLVLHCTFDEGSGSVVKDISGNGNDGTINGAEFVKLKSGYALRFDGVDDYVDCGEGPSLDIADAITLEAWVYVDEAQPGRLQEIVGRGRIGYQSASLNYYPFPNACNFCHPSPFGE